MSTQNKYALLGVALVVLIGVAGFNSYKKSTSVTAEVSQEPTQYHVVAVTIGDIYENNEVSISEDDTVLDVITMLSGIDPNMKLVTKEYSGLGTLIEGMYGFENGNDKKYWLYTINGIIPQIGADKLIPKTGDVIDWEFNTSTF